jgi:GT2 family glycosyltransferase
MNNLAPIALFCYNRLDTLKMTVESLLKNHLSSDSILFIFSDGPKSNEDLSNVMNVREYLKCIIGFKDIYIFESNHNKGLSRSLKDGIHYVFQNYDRIIVLEDDLELSNNFLLFMNSGLNYYDNYKNVLSICGYSPVMKGLSSNQIYFSKRSSSWGWGIWKNRWYLINWDLSSFKKFTYNIKNRYNLNKMGSDMSSLLNYYFKGTIQSWCLTFTFNQFLLDMYSVHPAISKVRNIGISHPNATNTKKNYFRFRTILDTSNVTNFNFSNHISINKYFIKQFKRDNSIYNRFLNKICITIDSLLNFK